MVGGIYLSRKFYNLSRGASLDPDNLTVTDTLAVLNDLTVTDDVTFGGDTTLTLGAAEIFTINSSSVVDSILFTGTGNLTAAEDLTRISTTGDLSSTSNVLALEQTTGDCTAGSYVLYISGGGTNIEGLHVDNGTCQFDETISIGAADLVPTATSLTIYGGDSASDDLFLVANTSDTGDSVDIVGGGDLTLATGTGKIILAPTTDIDLNPTGNDIHLLGSAAGKLTLAATSVTLYGGDSASDDLILNANTSDSELINIQGGGSINIVGPNGIKLDGTITLDDDGTIADSSNVTTITQNTITIAGATKINLDGPVDITGAATFDLTTATGISMTGTYSGSAIDLSTGTPTIDITLGTNARIKNLVDFATIGLGPVMVVDTFSHNDVTQTEAAASFAKGDDGGSFANIATISGEGGYSTNYQLFPDTEIENDAIYFGRATPFGNMFIDVVTGAAYGADSLTWEYYNGSWTALTIIWDKTDSTAQDGKRSFQADGDIFFSAPTDWTTTTIDSQLAYWVRARCNATVNITTIPILNSVEHKITTLDSGSAIPYAGTLSRGRFSFEVKSAANADTIVLLYNSTSGACSVLKTITKAKLDFAISDFALTVAKDDVVGFFCTQEDGTTEYAGGTCEFKITRT